MKKITWKRIGNRKTYGKKKWIAGIVVCCFFVVVAGKIWTAKKRVRGTDKDMKMSATVQTGTIQTSVSGTGSISYADSEKVLVPEDLEITDVKVSEGDSVTKGELLATVDESALVSCMSEIQENISKEDSTISEEKDNYINTTIAAGVAGRVKKIYAGEEDDVTDVMSEHGALMMISGDGYMAVSISGAANVSVGDEVTVTAENENTTGYVETVADGEAVIVWEDSVFDCETEVVVKNGEEITLGSGTAYVHEPIYVVGTTGIIEDVLVSENNKVSASTSVFSLKETGHTAEYEEALKNREALVSMLQTLVEIKKNGGITAKADGVVQSVNVQESTSDTDSSESTKVYSSATHLNLENTDYYAQLEHVEETTIVESQETVGAFAKMCTVTTVEKTGEPLDVETGTTTEEVSEEMTTEEMTEPVTEQSTEATTQTNEKDTEKDKKEKETQTDDEKQEKAEKEKAGGDSGSGGGVTTVTSTSMEDTESLSEKTVFVIAGGEQMKVEMYVDELDVGYMQKGLAAEISLDAMEDTVIDGTITKVGAQAGNSGGVAQYCVEITFEAEAGMLPGMSASVKVILEEAKDVLTIPLSAVTDEGNQSYVYKGYDENAEGLTEKTEVTLGVSDENQVEITDGLQEGDVVYYEMTKNSGETEDNGMEKGQQQMPGGMMETPGDMPGGGKPAGGNGGRQ